MERALNVALVVPEYRTALGEHGGLSTVADFLRTAFADAGWTTMVLSPRTSSKAAESRRVLSPRTWRQPVALTTRPDGVINVGAALAELEPARYLPRLSLTEVMDSCDVVVLIAGSPALAYIARRTRSPVVMHVATMVSVERKRMLSDSEHRWSRRLMTATVSFMDRRGVRIPDRVITMNPWMDEQARRLGAKRVVLAPPGVDTDVFRPPTEPRERHLLAVARLSDPRKDLETLIRAYGRARKLGVQYPLKLAGSGSLSPSVEELISAVGVREHVEVETDVSQERLIELYQDAALLLLSSVEEGLGLVLVEAMACGTPFVSTRTEGALHVIGISSVGQLVDIGDHEALARAVAEWVADPAARARAGRAARARAVADFSLDSAGRAIAEVVREVVRHN